MTEHNVLWTSECDQAILVRQAGGPSLRTRMLRLAQTTILPVLLVAAILLIAACSSPTVTTPGSGATKIGSGSTPTPSSHQAVQVTVFTLPTPDSDPKGIIKGPDGNFWFTECIPDGYDTHHCVGNHIGRITPDGQITEFPLSVRSGPNGITVGPDGNLWFTETPLPGTYSSPGQSYIGRITPAGQLTSFPYLGLLPSFGITTGPDGNLWFMTRGGISRITPDGQVARFTYNSRGSDYDAIVTGPDGNLWFLDSTVSQIGRITPDGQITTFPIPSGSSPLDLTVGPDGNLWFTENGANIGRITPGGQVTEFPLPSGISAFAIVARPDGNLWFTAGEQIGRISPGGQITMFPLQTPNSTPIYLAVGANGNLWFTDRNHNQVGRIVLGK